MTKKDKQCLNRPKTIDLWLRPLQIWKLGSTSQHGTDHSLGDTLKATFVVYFNEHLQKEKWSTHKEQHMDGWQVQLIPAFHSEHPSKGSKKANLSPDRSCNGYRRSKQWTSGCYYGRWHL